MPEVLVLYYSQGGAVREMAQLVARGIESNANINQILGLFNAEIQMRMTATGSAKGDSQNQKPTSV